MEEIKEILENPFDGLTKEQFQNKCFDIATKLFCNYCINCNGKQFYFAEIEFYYYQKGKWEEDWNKVTYARDGYSAGELFYHLSGVDICFDSSYEKRKFGGILIRSIIDTDNNVTAGPWNCMLQLLNNCKTSSVPLLEKLEETRQIEPKRTLRALGGKDMENFENNNQLKLCFYDDNIKEWKTKKLRYSKNRKGLDDTVKEDFTIYYRFNK